jgi:hypothetical protein
MFTLLFEQVAEIYHGSFSLIEVGALLWAVAPITALPVGTPSIVSRVDQAYSPSLTSKSEVTRSVTAGIKPDMRHLTATRYRTSRAFTVNLWPSACDGSPSCISDALEDIVPNTAETMPVSYCLDSAAISSSTSSVRVNQTNG